MNNIAKNIVFILLSITIYSCVDNGTPTDPLVGSWVHSAVINHYLDGTSVRKDFDDSCSVQVRSVFNEDGSFFRLPSNCRDDRKSGGTWENLENGQYLFVIMDTVGFRTQSLERTTGVTDFSREGYLLIHNEANEYKETTYKLDYYIDEYVRMDEEDYE
ncbi:MAG: hypothetical protein OCD76_07660 [Reichenbachiella sp.]